MGTITSTLVVCAATLMHSPPEQCLAYDRVDLVEVNHFYDEKGRLVFDQVIFYDWCHDQGRYNVRAWRLLKSPRQVPLRSGVSGYVTIWQDGEVLRKVHAEAFRESWTQYDPELVERDHLPKDQRRELQKFLVKYRPPARSHRTRAATETSQLPMHSSGTNRQRP